MQDSNPDVIKLDRDEAIRTILQLADLFNVSHPTMKRGLRAARERRKRLQAVVDAD